MSDHQLNQFNPMSAISKLCHVLEDERHLFVKCTIYQHEKENLFSKLTRKVPYFAGMNDVKNIFLVSNKLQQILNGLTNSCIMFQGSV